MTVRPGTSITAACAGLALATLALPGAAGAFGTIRGAGQNAEHEKITRAALACPPGTPSDGTCFEPLSIDSLAGTDGTFGGVGSPDIPPPEKAAAHCDEGDYLNPALYPKVARYPRTRAQANRALIACRTFLKRRFAQGLGAAPDMLDAQGRIIPGEVDLSSTCTFLGQLSGRGKCDVYDGFGRALHGVQDFYTHSNWSDRPVPAARVTDRNPPGLGRRTLAPLMNLRSSRRNPGIPQLLITGCFSLNEVNLSPIDGCRSGLRRTPRVRHLDLNKDKGNINPATGATNTPTTRRGRVGANFANAVRLAILDTRRQWADMRAELIRRYGAQRGNLMICALTRDDPVTTCQGRRVAIVIDSSGSNATNDPADLRVAAGRTLNSSLASAAEVGPTGVADLSAVIDFDSSARVVSPLGDPDGASFAGIDSSGGTNIASGISSGLSVLSADPRNLAGGRAGIVVLTDGEDSNVAALVQAVRNASAAGVRVSFGFLSPPSGPVTNARASLHAAPSPDLVQAILESGGVFSTIDSADAQEDFVGLVSSRGLTALDDPNGAEDGGEVAAGIGVTGRAGPGRDRDVYPFTARAGRLLTVSLTRLSGGALSLEAHDIAAGRRIGRVRTGAAGTATLRGRFRTGRRLELQVVSTAAGTYSVDVDEVGVDLRGTRRNDRLRCGDEPTFVVASNGDDVITCGPGDDMIVGGRGRDIQRGGPGDDIFRIARTDRHTGLERIDGGPGDDLVEFASRLRGRARCIPGRRIVFRSGRTRFEIRNVERITFAGRAC